MSNSKIKNNLLVVRRRYGLSRKQVAHLLGYKAPSSIARIEQGSRLPDPRTLLGFEILYRTPAAYLYAPWYAELRDELRAKEAALIPHQTGSEPASSEKGGSHA